MVAVPEPEGSAAAHFNPKSILQDSSFEIMESWVLLSLLPGCRRLTRG